MISVRFQGKPFNTTAIQVYAPRNGMDLTEAKAIKKRWQEYTEELYKKDLHKKDHDGVITHLEPDILECEVKWVQGYKAISSSVSLIMYDFSPHCLHRLPLSVFFFCPVFLWF